jgi:hypothetical protein
MEMPTGARFAAMRGMRKQVREAQNCIEQRHIVDAATALEELKEAFGFFSPHLAPTNSAKFRTAIKDLEKKISAYKEKAKVSID